FTFITFSTCNIISVCSPLDVITFLSAFFSFSLHGGLAGDAEQRRCFTFMHRIHEGKKSSTFTTTLTSAWLDIDRSHKIALIADEKRYLSVYIY
ncbi:unnamed protein product, partial [Staurois parvus]